MEAIFWYRIKDKEGVIIQIYKQMNQVKVEGAQIHAQAGALLSMIAKRALDAELYRI